MDYMNEINNMQNELQSERLKNAQIQKDYGQLSMFGSDNQSNLIQWQLDLREEMERIEHLLKGETLKTDDKGNERWTEQANDKYKPFNEYGVQLILNVISFYLNRNTILSNYDEAMINWKIKDLGDEIADMIFMKYEEMGMDSHDKQKLYPMIVISLLDTVHSAFLRALGGGERESLRTARHVTQNVQPQGEYYPQMQGTSNKFSVFKPTTWGK